MENASYTAKIRTTMVTSVPKTYQRNWKPLRLGDNRIVIQFQKAPQIQIKPPKENFFAFPPLATWSACRRLNFGDTPTISGKTRINHEVPHRGISAISFFVLRITVSEITKRRRGGVHAWPPTLPTRGVHLQFTGGFFKSQSHLRKQIERQWSFKIKLFWPSGFLGLWAAQRKEREISSWCIVCFENREAFILEVLPPCNFFFFLFFDDGGFKGGGRKEICVLFLIQNNVFKTCGNGRIRR